jgi:hypothetical protein
MWFIYFVLVVATMLSLSMLGWVTYLEGATARAKVVSPIEQAVPLPKPRPRQRKVVDVPEVVTVPKTAGAASKVKYKQHRGRWID